MLSGLGADAKAACLWIVAAACATHLFLVAAEHPLAHTTAHAKLAYWEMTKGRYARWFWVGGGLVLVGLAAPWVGALAVIPALAGILAYEHAYVQAGQAVPLA
jgi:hypothetical protein